MMDIFGGLLKFRYFWGVCEIPGIFWGVNSRCWARACAYGEQIRVPPPPGGLTSPMFVEYNHRPLFHCIQHIEA